jgi:transmembrane sensor
MTQQDTKERWWNEVDRDPIHETAAGWFARLRDSNVSLEDTLAWQAWMQEDPRHAQAFARIEEVSSALQSGPRPDLALAAEVGWDRYDGFVPIRDWRQRRNGPRLLAVAACALGAGIALVLLLGRGWLPGIGSAAAAFSTAVGENRTVQLTDGSKVTLGGNTAMKATLDGKSRRVELERGEAFFAVAKDTARPFKVLAGNATVVAVGTQFNVRRGTDRVVVDVVEGRVMVEPASGLVPMVLLRQFRPKLIPVRISAGEEATAGSVEVGPAIRISNLAAATSWQTGRLAFRMQPLRYVLEDVNRYSRKPIVIGDDAIADIRVTGTVMGNNVSGWVASLQSALGIVAVEEKDRTVLRNGR